MIHRFQTSAEARRYIEATGRSRIYTSGGRPPLPRCDHPQWRVDADGPWRTRGRIAPCSCTARDVIDPACLWVTLRHAEVVELDGAYIVDADPREASVMGERVALADGASVVLDRVPTLDLATTERERSRPTWPVREGDAEYTARLAQEDTR